MSSLQGIKERTGKSRITWSLTKQALARALPPAMAVIPVSMLFGVLAHRADWSFFDILAASALGFTGSGQFALLPLADTNAGFLTMLIICASINSRYLPISITTRNRLPNNLVARVFASHVLGDEAYATERNTDTVIQTLVIRSTIFFCWIVSGIIGAAVAKAIPASWLSSGIHLGYPASVVLVYLSVSQIRLHVASHYRLPLIMISVCLGVSVVIYLLMGPTFFWIPSIASIAAIIGWWESRE